MCDSSCLKEVTASVYPVTDNFPHRISPDTQDISTSSMLYKYFLDLNRRQQAFRSSSYITNIFSTDFIDAVSNEFKREGFISSVLMPEYADVLVGARFNYWDFVLQSMSGSEREFSFLLFSGMFSRQLDILHDQFKIESHRELYSFMYIKYLFITKDFDKLDASVQAFIDADSPKQQKYWAYRYYLLSRLYMKTAQQEDVDLSRELVSGLPDDGFNKWFMKQLEHSRKLINKN